MIKVSMDLFNINKQKILYVILFILIIYFLKFPVFFKPNGKTREYGIGIDSEGFSKTLYTFQFSIIIIALFLVISFK